MLPTRNSCRIALALPGLFAVVFAPALARGDEEPAAGPPAAELTASAAEAPPTWAFELGGAVAFTTAPIRGATTPFGVGLGGRAGFSFAGGVYVGASVIDYLGGQEENVTDTSLLYGLEGGYDLRLASFGGGRLVLRPQVGFGGLSVFRTDPSTTSAASTTSRSRPDVVSSASGSSSSSRSNVTTVDALYVQPGLTLMVTGGTFFAGTNANMLIVPSIAYSGGTTTWLSYGAEGRAGLRF